MATLKQVQDVLNPSKQGDNSDESLHKQLYTANVRIQDLEGSLKEIQISFREYRIEHDTYKKEAQLMESET